MTAQTTFPMEEAEGFDVVGDVHGQAAKLLALLEKLGYEEEGGAWRHRTRRAIFVGDLVDRGPGQIEVLRTVRAMRASGAAIVLAGNHEFNAVAFHTPDPRAAGEYLRRHSEKNRSQHAQFLEQVGHGSTHHDELVDWFRTLPLWLELDGIRVVHACWDPTAIGHLRPLTSGAGALTDELLHAAHERDSETWMAVEHLLKGPELPIDPPYLDPGGHLRRRARFCWWRPDADRLDRAVVIPNGATTQDGAPYPDVPDVPITVVPVAPYRDEVPVIFGHYWFEAPLKVTSPHTACVDYSAGKAGPLVAYRWSGEATLDDRYFVAAG